VLEVQKKKKRKVNINNDLAVLPSHDKQHGKLGSNAEKIARWRDTEDRHRDITDT